MNFQHVSSQDVDECDLSTIYREGGDRVGDRSVYESHFTVYETRGLKSRGYLTNCRANIIRLEKNYTLSRKIMRYVVSSC